MTSSYQQLIAAAYGLLSEAAARQPGVVSAYTNISNIAEVTNETFLQPQPVGLTNTQCKVIGPYFTSNPTHCHPEALQKDCQGVIFTPAASILLSNPHATAYFRGGDEDEDLETQKMLLMSVLPLSVCRSFEELLREAHAGPTGEHAETVAGALATVQCVRLSVSAFGHALERVVSVASLGLECYWNTVRDALRASVEDETAFASAVEATGVSATCRDVLRHYLQTGLPIPVNLTWVFLFLLADLYRRPVVLGKTERDPAIVFLPTRHAPSACSNWPLLLQFDGATASAATVACSGSEAFHLSIGEDAVIIPLSAGEELHSAYLRFGDRSSQLCINPTPTEPQRCVFRFITVAEDAPCRPWLGYDPAALSFRSFPASYFYLAAEDRVANDLLLSPGFGQDLSGSLEYLSATLKSTMNLAPLHVDADGHCLIHSLSRCMIGKEYLWHALRHELHVTLREEKGRYAEHFRRNEALAALCDEMDSLVARSDPNYQGNGEVLTTARGLGVEHLFVLSNILRRPILLMDASDHRNSEGWLVLPLFVPPTQCTTRKLLVVAWSSAAHAHYVPVVPVVGSAEAAVLLDALPFSHDRSSLQVYACPSDQPPNELVDQYVEFRQEPRRALVGGEVALDTRSWCQGVVEDFESRHGFSIWMVHEAARFLVGMGGRSASELAVIKDIAKFDDLVTAIATSPSEPLRYCPVCTGTTVKAVCCETVKTRIIDRRKGSVTYEDLDRLPIASTLGFACCLFKHWSASPTVQVGALVFARDVTSAFQLARIERIDKERSEYDLRFLWGGVGASAMRYCCPASEVQTGFPVDFNPKEYWMGRGEARVKYRILYDGNDLIRCDPTKAANEIMDGIIPKLVRRGPVDPAVARDIRKLVEADLKEILNQHERTAKRAAVKWDRMPMGGKSATSPALPSASPSKREPVRFDSDGRRIVWESMDPRSLEWHQYTERESADIEAAYAAKDLSFPLELAGIGSFTIHFPSWKQLNALGYGRPIRRLAFGRWTCPNCTVEHEPNSSMYCDICAGEGVRSARPSNSFELKDEFSERRQTLQQQPRSGSSSFYDDDDEEYILDEIELFEQVYTEARSDPALARGGSLFESAVSVSSGSTSRLIRMPGYTEFSFMYDPVEDRYVPVPNYMKADHPLARTIREHGAPRPSSNGVVYALHGMGFRESGGRFQRVTLTRV